MPKSRFAHFTYVDRQKLNSLLNDNLSFRKMALILGCSPSSITNEIKGHRVYKDYSFGTSKRKCFSDRLIKAPFVCNGCNNLGSCKKSKYFYDPNVAYKEYKDKLSSSRRGIHSSSEGIAYINEIVSPLVLKQGQTIDHILLSNDIGISRSTLYRYIDAGLLDVKNVDLKRRVRYVVKKKKKEVRIKVNRKGRKYLDFLAYIHTNKIKNITEMDTVIAKREEPKCILTMLLRKSNFMLGFILPSKEAMQVVKVFDYLEKKLGKGRFKTLFNVVLTDNGTEFDYVDKLEANDRKIPRCKVFYCDPRASEQKGKLEKNHEYIRYFYPKGVSFNDLDQDKLNLMFSHINSVRRKELKNKSPFELLSKAELNDMKKLGYKHIPPQDVILSAKLFKK